MDISTPSIITNLMINELGKYLNKKYYKLFEYKPRNFQLNFLLENTILNEDIINEIIEYTYDPVTLFDPCFGKGNLIKKIQNNFKNIIFEENVYGYEFNFSLNNFDNLLSLEGNGFNNLIYREFLF